MLIAPDAALPDAPVRVGITSVAAEALGRLVFVDLPEVGSTIVAGESCGELESTKSVSDLYAAGQLVTSPRSTRPSWTTRAWSPPIRTVRAGCSRCSPTAAGTLLTAAEYAENEWSAGMSILDQRLERFRPRGRRGDRCRAAPPAVRAGDDRVGELRPASPSCRPRAPC